MSLPTRALAVLALDLEIGGMKYSQAVLYVIVCLEDLFTRCQDLIISEPH